MTEQREPIVGVADKGEFDYEDGLSVRKYKEPSIESLGSSSASAWSGDADEFVENAVNAGLKRKKEAEQKKEAEKRRKQKIDEEFFAALPTMSPDDRHYALEGWKWMAEEDKKAEEEEKAQEQKVKDARQLYSEISIVMRFWLQKLKENDWKPVKMQQYEEEMVDLVSEFRARTALAELDKILDRTQSA